jgi:hypothetical protein
LLYEDLEVHPDFNSQSGNSLGGVEVHFLAFLHTPNSMKCDSRASFLACAFANPCLGHKLKVRVATITVLIKIYYTKNNYKHFNIVINSKIETNSPILDGNHGWLCTLL